MSQKPSLTLDKEFLEYCRLNDIENPKKLAKETFERGFSILKFGETPSIVKGKETIKEVEKEVVKEVEVIKEVEKEVEKIIEVEAKIDLSVPSDIAELEKKLENRLQK